MLRRAGAGFGSLALAALLADEARGRGRRPNPLAPRTPHFPARAKRVIFLFMPGGPSHVDTFDPKPRLTQRQRQALAQALPGPDAEPAGLAVEVPASTASPASRSANCSRTSARCVDDCASSARWSPTTSTTPAAACR